ncbi:sentrin-specific protease 5-like [Galendromus occidentalis]|uniref:Sentrin-specific protease 5-like n=1 Tax=Galendromus occidentalis TaxID=34638 RepID=A0AAJ7P9U2_9ACAR|nr:sentrin-specific protease 5-like [Galendromus occidentalis]
MTISPCFKHSSSNSKRATYSVEVSSIPVQKMESSKIQSELQGAAGPIRKRDVDRRMRNNARSMKPTEASPSEEDNIELCSESSSGFFDAFDPQYPPITKKMNQAIENALKCPANHVLTHFAGQPLTRSDLETLVGDNWLNDTIVNAYLNLLVIQSKEIPFSPKIYTFSTFFLERYFVMGYNAVREWTRDEDIFAHDILLVPVHVGAHLCLVVVDQRKKTITFMDPNGGKNEPLLVVVLAYLTDEFRVKKNSQVCFSDWQMETEHDLPKQVNPSDCGVFVLKYAELATRSCIGGFSHGDVPYIRRKMMHDLIETRIPPGLMEVLDRFASGISPDYVPRARPLATEIQATMRSVFNFQFSPHKTPIQNPTKFRKLLQEVTEVGGLLDDTVITSRLLEASPDTWANFIQSWELSLVNGKRSSIFMQPSKTKKAAPSERQTILNLYGAIENEETRLKCRSRNQQ